MKNHRFYFGFFGFLAYLGFQNPLFFLFFLFFLFWLSPEIRPPNLIKSQVQEKKKRLQMIKDFMGNKKKITNKDAVALLNVSNATAVRYLNELENSGFLKQVGKTGKNVYYSKQ